MSELPRLVKRQALAKLALLSLHLAVVIPLLVGACGGTSPSSTSEMAGASGVAPSGAATSAGSNSGGGNSGGGNSGGKSGAGGSGGNSGSSVGGSSVGGSSGGAMAGGQAGAGGGGSGQLCGGQTCTVDQICCGPNICGHCISKLSGQACPATCPSGGGGTGGTASCSQLLDQVTQAQAAAQACNPASAKPTPECAGSLEGLCCPIGVESASATAPANVAYLDALKSYKASCSHPCPRIACIEPMVGDCKASSAANGKCAP